MEDNEDKKENIRKMQELIDDEQKEILQKEIEENFNKLVNSKKTPKNTIYCVSS